MTREQLGHLTAIRNLLHGAPQSQASLALRLREIDLLLADEWQSRGRMFRLRREPDYAAIAGRILDQLGQHR